jgi:hypothetical protein
VAKGVKAGGATCCRGAAGAADRDGKHYSLHAGGGIGAEGANAAVLVQLDGTLAHYRLPDPPEGTALAEAIRASLAILDDRPLAPGRMARTAEVLVAHNTTVYRVARRFPQQGEWGLLDRREDNGTAKFDRPY